MSPTYSQITENQDPELYTILKQFEINKKLLKEDLYSEKNSEKRKDFKTFGRTQGDELQQEYYKFLNNSRK